MEKQTVRDVDVAGKRVFVRADFNVPIEDGRITDDSRIRASLPTLHHLIERGARVILASHLGRPKGKVNDALRLKPVADRLSQLLRRPVRMTGDALGAGVVDAVNKLRPGDVLLLENLRFHAEEEANDPKFAEALAKLADVYVNDAFGAAHRAHASTEGITRFLPSVAGLLLEREVDALSRLLENPPSPFMAVIGGAKVSGKVDVLRALLDRCAAVLLGGGMANTFLAAQGRAMGKSLVERDQIETARAILDEADRRNVALRVPVDLVVAPQIHHRAKTEVVPVDRVPKDWTTVDIGPETVQSYSEVLASARSVFWNGPMGVFEISRFAEGTEAIGRVLAELAERGTVTIVGGGDSLAAVERLGLARRMTHASTGGGASLEFLEGKTLPGVAALPDREPSPARTGAIAAGGRDGRG